GYVLWRRSARRFRVLTGRAPIPLPVGVSGAGAGTTAPPVGAEIPAPKARSRHRRVVAAVLAIAVVVTPIGWGVYRGVSADRHLNDALDEVNRDDPGWHMGEIEAARKPI